MRGGKLLFAAVRQTTIYCNNAHRVMNTDAESVTRTLAAGTAR